MASGDVLIDYTASPVEVRSYDESGSRKEQVQLNGSQNVTIGGVQRILTRNVTLVAALHANDPNQDSPFERDKQYQVTITEV